MKVKKETRQARARQTAEVFTPDKLVQEMLEKLPRSSWVEGKTFCDPACGNGQFLVWVLAKKLIRGHNPTDALKTIYGVDIMPDNVGECRARLLKMLSRWQKITREHILVVVRNIVCHNALTFDFEFENYNSAEVDKLFDLVKNHAILDTVEIPFNNQI